MLKHSKVGMVVLAALMLLAGAASAQPGGAAPGGKIAAAPAAGDPLPPDLVKALKSGNQRSIDMELKKFNITAPPGTPPRHECGSTQCSCAGVKGCSTIATACKEDTLSCVKDSCICTKK